MVTSEEIAETLDKLIDKFTNEHWHDERSKTSFMMGIKAAKEVLLKKKIAPSNRMASSSSGPG